jgi:hypothetical protein
MILTEFQVLITVESAQVVSAYEQLCICIGKVCTFAAYERTIKPQAWEIHAFILSLFSWFHL